MKVVRNSKRVHERVSGMFFKSSVERIFLLEITSHSDKETDRNMENQKHELLVRMWKTCPGNTNPRRGKWLPEHVLREQGSNNCIGFTREKKAVGLKSAKTDNRGSKRERRDDQA